MRWLKIAKKFMVIVWLIFVNFFIFHFPSFLDFY